MKYILSILLIVSATLLQAQDLGRTMPAKLADWSKPVITPFDKGVITKNTKVVYLNADAQGKRVIGEFNSGLLPVFNNDKKLWGFLDTDGNLVIDYFYQKPYPIPLFSDGICLLDKEGEKEVTTEFGARKVKVTMFDMMDTKGNIIVNNLSTAFLYKFNHGVSLGMILQQGGAGTYTAPVYTIAYFNKIGQQLSSYPATQRKGHIDAWERENTFRELHEGRRAYYDFNQKLWGFLDENGKIILPAKYLEVGDFSDGLALFGVKRDNESYWGYMDQWGNIVIEAKFSNKPLPFSHGYAVATRRNNSKCLIDKKGNVVFDNFKEMTQFYKGYAFMSVDGTYYLIDTNFNKLKRVKYFPDVKNMRDGTTIFTNDLALVNLSYLDTRLIDYMGNVINDSNKVGLFRDGRAFYDTGYSFEKGYERISGYLNTKGELVFIFKDNVF